MAGLVIYGTELEDVDNEKSGVISKRPLSVQEQVVKDERGRRRFHGAFTGGFSAGYFNTVGSKEGWAPKQFRSSRGERGELMDYKPEDFMDEEDLSEFGIAARKMKISAGAGGSTADKHLLAWERSTQSSLTSALSDQLQKIIRPISESVGKQILKKMGWREGEGIGAKMSRKSLEKQKLNEDRCLGKRGNYDANVVKEANEMAPGFLFAPKDVGTAVLKSIEGVHGLGYRGIEQTSVLSEKYGIMETTLKMRKTGKGISGQAFGVGAFEDDDANIYTSYDLSQYDFAIGGNEETQASCSSDDTSFVLASRRQSARQFFEPPRIPSNFRLVHTPIYTDFKQMPENVKQLSEKMNHVQRAKLLGEIDSKVVFELINDKDRERLNTPKSDLKNAFEEEPMKQSRFIQYLNYLKRGLNFPQPSELTTLEWEKELNDFQNILPPELRSLIPEVKMRQKPLARIDLAAPIADVLKSKFTSSLNCSSNKEAKTKDERFAAVKMKMFGEKTRLSYEWHPAKQLAKLFNLPDPYPSLSLTGVPQLQKTIKSETLANLGANDSLFSSAAPASIEKVDLETTEKTSRKNETNDEKEEEYEKISKEFLKAIFDDSEKSDSDTDDAESEIIHQKEAVPANSEKFTGEVKENNKAETQRKLITVMDLPLGDENEEFGPTPPPFISATTANVTKDIVMRREKRKKYRKHRKEKNRKNKKKEKKKKHKRHGRQRGQNSNSETSNSTTSTD